MGVKFSELQMASLNLHLMPDGTYAKLIDASVPQVKKTAATSKETLRTHVQYVGNVVKMNIKPMSVNDAWKGRRFKSKEYIEYERAVLAMLPNFVLPASPLKINYEFGFSSKRSDIDNPAKALTDILSKKYHFNDNEVYQMNIKKVIVNRGEEYILWQIESII